MRSQIESLNQSLRFGAVLLSVPYVRPGLAAGLSSSNGATWPVAGSELAMKIR